MKLASLEAGCRRMRTRFWTCADRCSQVHSDDEYGTDFLRNSLQLGTYANNALFEQLCCNGVTLPKTLERIRPCQLDMERAQMMTRCKTTLKKCKGRTKANTKSRMEIARPEHQLYRHQHVQELWQNWTLGGRLLETKWTSVRQFHQ